jgi:hypothetical protein
MKEAAVIKLIIWEKNENFEELWFIFWNAFDTSLVG